MRACGRRVDGPFLWQLYEYRLSADTNSICCLSQAVKLHPKLNLHVMYTNSVKTAGQDDDENFHCIDTVRDADLPTSFTLPLNFERVSHIFTLWSMLCTHIIVCLLILVPQMPLPRSYTSRANLYPTRSVGRVPALFVLQLHTQHHIQRVHTCRSCACICHGVQF